MTGQSGKRETIPQKKVLEDLHTYPAEFINCLETAISACAKTFASGCFMIVELENLPMIIQAHGHEKSEDIVSDFATQIANLVDGDGSSVFRIQRNQFGIICNLCEKDEAMSIGSRINNLAHNFGSHTQVPIHLITNVGSVDFPNTARSAMDAINKALVALSDKSILNFSSYSGHDSLTQKSIQQMEVAQYLNRAIQKKKLRLGFQPIIEAKTGKIDHYESLLRVIGDDGQISSAGVLIPIAEKMGMIHLIDELVLEMVINELKLSQNVQLGFNISNLTTSDNKWLSHFTEIMSKHPEIASRMIIEITETAAHRDLRETAYFIASLQAIGCRVALDDFGSGYTSFRQLKGLSVDIVKIDGSFVKDLVDNADNRFFVKTLLDFTNAFGLETVAECVESGEVAKLLMELGVSHMQGFYFSKPLNHRAWLSEGEYGKEI